MVCIVSLNDKGKTKSIQKYEFYVVCTFLYLS